jgi:D-arabinose 1-dehydrogenase-like Zn-dependent alcohol dehydrogenase
MYRDAVSDANAEPISIFKGKHVVVTFVDGAAECDAFIEEWVNQCENIVDTAYWPEGIFEIFTNGRYRIRK